MAASGLATLAPQARASHQNLTIKVGSDLKGAPAESMRFHTPDTLLVHPGDTLTFDFRGFHTATLLPVNAGAEDWLFDNAREGNPYSFAVRDPDDGANAWKDNFSKVTEPTDTDCGDSGEPACNYTGAAVMNSGTPFELPSTFTVDVNASAGSTFWIVSLTHHHMRLRVKVVADQNAATTQAAVDAAKNRQVARDTDWAIATHKKYNGQRTFHTTSSGKKVWDAWAGVDSRFVSLYAFYPKKLVIAKGDTVRWRFDSLVMEDHTVSMPDPGIFSNLQFDENKCDPDGDAGSGPDTNPTFNPETGAPECPGGSVLETDVSHQFWGGKGDGILRTNPDVEHSGIRGPQAQFLDPPTAGDGHYDVKFTQTTSAQGKSYFCFLHPMGGSVVVQ
jgi:plastocyanin